MTSSKARCGQHAAARTDLRGHRSGGITTHYSAAELSRLFDAASRVCAFAPSGVHLLPRVFLHVGNDRLHLLLAWRLDAPPATPSHNEVTAPVEEHKTLRVLLAINGAMFFVEIVTGWLAESTGLIADSLDMFADAAVYGVSLYAVGKAATMQMRAARFSGYLQLILAFGALFEVSRRFLVGSDPEPPLMIGVALLALVANLTCMALIAKHRQGGAHMRASWIFSPNDVIANVGVILAGALVAWTGSHLPDLVVGAIIALVVLSGAIRILRLSGMPAPDSK